MNLLHKVGQKPIIAAVRNLQYVEKAIESQVDNIFFMGGTVKEIINAVQLVKQAGKSAFVHVDLIKGLSNTDKETVSFIADYIGADGIVTPKSHLIAEAKKANLFGILHLFIIDSLALQNGLRAVENVCPDGVELMPGVVRKTIAAFTDAYNHIPIIASGLIHTKEDAVECLEAGATSLSVSEQSLWSLTFQDI
ncbi:glycerol-3-phosphate responsive antiterminator [Paenibacillus sp. BR2-3]|uniref:glycerol-3-phosphate responsive antiterminator n=1 Tax=Paenibacillus sp. BR2-3 TaxID=3048494 RepID=UPI003977A4F1